MGKSIFFNFDFTLFTCIAKKTEGRWWGREGAKDKKAGMCAPSHECAKKAARSPAHVPAARDRTGDCSPEKNRVNRQHHGGSSAHVLMPSDLKGMPLAGRVLAPSPPQRSADKTAGQRGRESGRGRALSRRRGPRQVEHQVEHRA